MAIDHGLISQRMKELKIRQKQIAAVLGVTKSSVSRKLSGQLTISLPEFLIIARMLQLDVRDAIRAFGYDPDTGPRKVPPPVKE
ncbi:helix-turn-helix domain-containing protein [Oceanibaculum indicum]|uniref:HTH cro/C1-type domain-containing protein n=1 Tax=Oceanibaculum indicum P24 TaxID=1207063 RepID=K2K024_9PROT|nr:helix-turn-helix transcriptional regulator [Oceanibaculum indicum]EKE70875.1 hypothetical protein P24_15069 [Oceanibaculum indicum P24]